MKKKFDNSVLGTLIGIIAPLITFYIINSYIYPFEYADKTLNNYLMYAIVPKVMSLAAIPNLAFFFLFIYTNRLKSAKGVLGATIVIAILVFIIKLAN